MKIKLFKKLKKKLKKSTSLKVNPKTLHFLSPLIKIESVYCLSYL